MNEAIIAFVHVSDLDRSTEFYRGRLGLTLAVDQGDCRIYRVTNSAFLGICERPERIQQDGFIVTLVTDDVDGTHDQLVAAGVTVVSAPTHSDTYGIYHGLYRDPDGHLVEIQRFDDPTWLEPL